MNAQRVREFRHLRAVTETERPDAFERLSWTPRSGVEPVVLGIYTQLLKENDLLKAQLAQAQRMESIGRFLPGIVHDFNHLLTHIIGFTELSMTCLPEDHAASRNLGKVKEAGLKAAALTRKLLAHCRREDAERSLVDLSEVVGEMGGLFQRMLGDTIQVEMSLHPALSHVLVDQVQIEQLLMNLVVNAMDSMPEGGCVFLKTSQAEVGLSDASGIPPGSYVTLAVEDTGTGMTQAVLESACKPFFTTKAPGQGSGLGLPLVAAIVEAHGGHLRITSQPGQGSQFAVYLPVVEPMETIDPEEEEHRA